MSQFQLMQDAPKADAPPADAPPADDAAAKDASADQAPAEKKQGGKTPMVFYLWGAMSTWLLVDGYLTYNTYTTLATTLVTNKVSNNTSWTASIVQGNAPISYWLYSSYLAMGLESVSVLGWLMGVMGNKAGFLKIARMAMLFPLIEAAAWSFTYLSYTACSSTTATQFDGTTTSVTQLSSCSGATSTDSGFGTSGTTAPYVSTDNYSTWFATNVGSDVGMIAINMMGKKALTKMVAAKEKKSKEEDDAKTAASDATADPAAAPADPAAAPADPTPAPADPAPAPKDDNNGGFGDGSNWSEPAPAPAPAPEPEPEPKKCGYWGCL